MSTLYVSPHSTDQRFLNHGSSGDLLTKLFSFFDAEKENLSEVYLCLYLYNNELIHNKVKELASYGISVKVISLPLEGYDTRYPKDIIDPVSNTVVYHNATKYSLAQNIYDDVTRFNNENYILYVFGHTYVRSSGFSNFARGTLPYSLHTKSFFFKMRDGRSITGLTSSNLAVRDASKDEIMVLLDDTPETRANSELFFNTLIANSVRHTEWHNPNPYFCYNMDCIDTGVPGNNSFAAPFYSDSPSRIEDKITEVLSTAQSRIYVCAEHLAAYNYPDLEGNNRPGIFSTIFEKCRQGIPVKCLSQTYVDSNGDSHNQREPQNPGMFSQLIREVNSLPQCSYAANKNVHAKFIIVDDTVILSSANYTPTEFIYGPVRIDRFVSERLDGVRYNGIFSEVSHFIIISNHDVAEQLINFFESILNQNETYIHNSAPTQPNVINANVGRFYINCPYAEKDQAKALGALWDGDRKKWYYTSQEQAHLFQRWL